VNAKSGETVTYTCECCNRTSDYPKDVFDLIQRGRLAQRLPFHVKDSTVRAKVATILKLAIDEQAREAALPPEERERRAVRRRQYEVEQQRAKEARKAQAVVYYVHRGDRIKIGTTTVGEKRWKAHGGALLATEPGSFELERQRHERFAASRIGTSEWFQATPELLAWIATLQRLTLKRWHRKEPRS
jgi:hypothetical protein